MLLTKDLFIKDTKKINSFFTIYVSAIILSKQFFENSMQL